MKTEIGAAQEGLTSTDFSKVRLVPKAKCCELLQTGYPIKSTEAPKYLSAKQTSKSVRIYNVKFRRQTVIITSMRVGFNTHTNMMMSCHS